MATIGTIRYDPEIAIQIRIKEEFDEKKGFIRYHLAVGDVAYMVRTFGNGDSEEENGNRGHGKDFRGSYWPGFFNRLNHFQIRRYKHLGEAIKVYHKMTAEARRVNEITMRNRKDIMRKFKDEEINGDSKVIKLDGRTR